MEQSSTIFGQGVPLMVVGMSVVFVALAILMMLIIGFRRLFVWIQARKSTADVSGAPPEISGEVIAAIAFTLIMEDEQSHDEESLVLTMLKLPKPYNNWWVRGRNEVIRYAVDRTNPVTGMGKTN